MRHFVTLQTEPTAEDALGQPSGDWSDILSGIPCEYEQLSGDELERARVKFDGAVYQISICRPTGFEVTEAMRAIVRTAMKTRTLEIGHVGEDESDMMRLVLLCKDVV